MYKIEWDKETGGVLLSSKESLERDFGHFASSCLV